MVNPTWEFITLYPLMKTVKDAFSTAGLAKIQSEQVTVTLLTLGLVRPVRGKAFTGPGVRDYLRDHEQDEKRILEQDNTDPYDTTS